MIAEQIESKVDDLGYIPDHITRAILDTMNEYWNRYYDSIVTEGKDAYEGKIAAVTQMVFATVMEEQMGIAIDEIGKANKYLGFDLDVYIEMLENAIGVTWDNVNKCMTDTGFGFLGIQEAWIEYNRNTVHAIGKKIFGEALYQEGMKTYEIAAIETKTLKELEDMILNIEAGEMPFTEEQLEQLLYLAGQADGIINAIEGGIELVMAQVEELIEPLIGKVVAEKMTEYDSRLTTLEEIVGQHEYFFFDWLLDMLAQIITPGQSIVNAAEEIKTYLENYINAELIEIWEQMIYLLQRIQGIDAVTIIQVQNMIDKSISEIEFPENGNGEVGPVGPQGPMGLTGPVGATGPKGETGEAGEGQFELEQEIAGIDAALYDRLSTVGFEYGNTITEITDWTVEAIGAINIKIGEEVQPLIDTLTTEVLESITAIVEAFETPEAVIAFLLNVPEGEEKAMYDLMQLLIANTLELEVE